VAHFIIFRIGAPWINVGAAGAMRPIIAAFFCPKPLLDADSSVAIHYGVTAFVQLLLLTAGTLILRQSELPARALQAIVFAAGLMWPLLLLLRLVLAAPNVEPQGANAFSEKVKAGNVQVQPLAAEHVVLPQVAGFAQRFCEAYFQSAFRVQDGIAKLDLTGTDLDVASSCSALALIEPLTADIHGFEVNLEGTAVCDDDILDLAKHFRPTLRSLEVNLAGTKVGDEGVFALAQSLPRMLTNFEAGLNSTSVGDDGMAALAARLPRSLLSLEAVFYNTQVGDRGVVALARHLPPGLSNFRAGLYRTKVGDEGVIALADSMPETLTVLKADLAGTKVTDAGAAALAEKLPELMRLEKFDSNFSGTKVTDEVKTLLKKATKASSTPTFKGRQRASVVEVVQAEQKGYCCSIWGPWFCTRDATATTV